jgi:predicted dehydrogenase
MSSPLTHTFPTRRRILSAAAFAPGLAGAAQAPSDTVRIGVIGTGGRARRLMAALDLVRGTRIAGLADIWDPALAQAAKLAPAGVYTTHQYSELLARKDIDAVIIGSPNHWHAQMTIDACAAGKDVYVEKPLTHTIAEGAKVIEAQNRFRRVVQVGTQQRSMPHLIKAREIVKSGRLGAIHKIHMTWNRNTPRRLSTPPAATANDVSWRDFVGPSSPQDFDAYRFRNWRWFWDFGDGIFGDLMVHWLDTVNWMLDLPMPASATAIGDNIHAQGVWETPDTVQALLQYPDRRVQAYFEGTFVNQRNAAMTELMGTEGTLYFDRGRFEVLPEPKRDAQGRPLENPLRPDEWILGDGPRGADFYQNPDGESLHLANWVECIRSRRRPACPAEDGVLSSDGSHLANLALRRGQVVRWADVKV